MPEIALCIAGVVERGIWSWWQPAQGASGEAMNVAIALGEGRGFAGAFGAGHGATAHLLPPGPAMAGLVYGWLPPRSPGAEAILAAWSIGLAIATYMLLYRALGHLQVPRRARLAALAIGLLVPAYFTLETVDFRVWEGGLASALTALFLERVIAAHRRLAGERGAASHRASRFPLVPIGCACLLFCVNPVLGMGAFACLTMLGIMLLSPRANIVGSGIALGLLAIAIVPWTVRNYHALGAIVPLRSNAGLELALANNRAMLDTTDPSRALEQRLRAIHPTANARVRAEVVRIGEVAYARRLGAEAERWIADNPGSVARLWSRHVRQMLFPDRWITDPRHSLGGSVRAVVIQLIGVAGLAGLALLLGRRRQDGAVYPAVLIVTVIVLLAPFQPVSRYTYSLYPMLCLISSGLILVLDRYRSTQVS